MDGKMTEHNYKVWIVYHGYYSDKNIERVFDSKEKAEKHLNKILFGEENHYQTRLQRAQIDLADYERDPKQYMENHHLQGHAKLFDNPLYERLNTIHANLQSSVLYWKKVISGERKPDSSDDYYIEEYDVY